MSLPDASAELSAAPRRGMSAFEMLLAAGGSCVVLFVVAPLVGLVWSTRLGDVSAALADHEVTDSIVLTLLAALLAVAVATIGGVPLGWLLARKRFRGRAVLMGIIDLPIVIPHSAAGVALLTVVGRRSLLGHLVKHGLVSTVAGISVAMAFVSVPFLVNSARDAFEAVPERLERVARTLGASPLRVWFTLSLPMAWRGVLSGMILMWARGISEFGAVIIIAYHPMTTPVLIYRRFLAGGLESARAVAVALIVICVVLFAALRLLASRRRGEREDRRA